MVVVCSLGSFYLESRGPSKTAGSGAGVEKCYVVPGKREGEPATVQTEGVNLEVLWEHDDLVDASRVSTNDVAATLNTLGVEAARSTIVREVVGLFDAYGIAVNSRHLNLIADFMTQQVKGTALRLPALHGTSVSELLCFERISCKEVTSQGVKGLHMRRDSGNGKGGGVGCKLLKCGHYGEMAAISQSLQWIQICCHLPGGSAGLSYNGKHGVRGDQSSTRFPLCCGLFCCALEGARNTVFK